MPKAQISAEFLIFLALAFLIAIAFEIASLEQLKDFRVKKETESVNDLALKLQRELLLAATVEDGYLRSFNIPNTLDSINYSLIMQNSSITVQSRNAYYVLPIPSVIGNLSKGANIINKTGGVIHIN